MRNILAHISHKAKYAFAENLKAIWLAPPENKPAGWPKKSAGSTSTVFPKTSAVWKMVWRTLSFYAFPQWGTRKISSTNVLQRLNWEIRCTGVVGIFPGIDVHTRQVAIYLMEYAEDWSTSKASPTSSLFKLCYFLRA